MKRQKKINKILKSLGDPNRIKLVICDGHTVGFIYPQDKGRLEVKAIKILLGADEMLHSRLNPNVRITEYNEIKLATKDDCNRIGLCESSCDPKYIDFDPS